MATGCVSYSAYAPNKMGKNEGLLTIAVEGVIIELRKLLKEKGLGDIYRVYHSNELTFDEICKYRQMRSTDYFRKIKRKNVSDIEIDDYYGDNYMRPDGGVIWIERKGTNVKYPLLVSEMKTQGTNDGRVDKGLKKQACGNAIERLGSYIMPLLMMYEYDDPIYPFVSFACGCDFNFDENGHAIERSSKVQGGKLVRMTGGMNKFNQVITSKTMPVYRHIKPNTNLAKKDPWTVSEMKAILIEVAKDSLQYFLAEDMPKRKVKTLNGLDVLKMKK